MDFRDFGIITGPSLNLTLFSWFSILEISTNFIVFFSSTKKNCKGDFLLKRKKINASSSLCGILQLEAQVTTLPEKSGTFCEFVMLTDGR